MYSSILVVDDNQSILTALKICLAGTFENIITLSHPDKMLQLMEQELPDAVLLDMNFSLGVNSGQEGLTWLRAVSKKHPDIPIILMTAYADVQLAVKGMKMGAADFITKPWNNDELIRVIKDAIERSNDIATLEDIESEHVRRIVDKCKGNITEAAKLLGITRQTLYTRLKR